MKPLKQPGFSLTHKFVRFGSYFRQMTCKINIATRCTHKVLVKMSWTTAYFIVSNNIYLCQLFKLLQKVFKYQFASVRRSILFCFNRHSTIQFICQVTDHQSRLHNTILLVFQVTDHQSRLHYTILLIFQVTTTYTCYLTLYCHYSRLQTTSQGYTH